MSLPVCTHRSVEVYVVDAPSAAAFALGGTRTDAESTHVLCRHADESTPDFSRRVLRRLERIQRGQRVRSLWYVVGSEAARARGAARLLRSLLPSLESGTGLTVVGPVSCQRTVFEWIDSIVDSTLGEVSVSAQLYADGAHPAFVQGAHRASGATAPSATAPSATALRAAAAVRSRLPLERFARERLGMEAVASFAGGGVAGA